MSARVTQSSNIQPLVSTGLPVLLVGGAPVSDKTLKICQNLTDISVAADSGADRLHRAGITPVAVIGDLDSLSAKGQRVFADRLFPVASQDTTDFEKCIGSIVAPLVLAPGFLGGRLDHSFATLNVLARFADHPVILVAEDEVAFATSGPMSINLDPGTPFALLPMAPVQVTTTGLQWNLTDQRLAPDGLVSSSNTVASGPVRVDTTGPLIVTVPVCALDAVQDAVRAR